MHYNTNETLKQNQTNEKIIILIISRNFLI